MKDYKIYNFKITNIFGVLIFVLIKSYDFLLFYSTTVTQIVSEKEQKKIFYIIDNTIYYLFNIFTYLIYLFI